jgi:hypothetical protein
MANLDRVNNSGGRNEISSFDGEKSDDSRTRDEPRSPRAESLMFGELDELGDAKFAVVGQFRDRIIVSTQDSVGLRLLNGLVI